MMEASGLSLATASIKPSCSSVLREQFPTERKWKDNIEWAIELANDNEARVSVLSTQLENKVSATLETYTAAQEAIKKCTDMVGVGICS